jgi:phosphatidylserine/phosphatidylglycerophosphate/cardiolipin synthase-like enzyme
MIDSLVPITSKNSDKFWAVWHVLQMKLERIQAKYFLRSGGMAGETATGTPAAGI